MRKKIVSVLSVGNPKKVFFSLFLYENLNAGTPNTAVTTVNVIWLACLFISRNARLNKKLS